MLNVTVTMLQSGRTDDWGRPLVAGSSYSLEFDRAKSLWQAGFAYVADPEIFEENNTPYAGGFLRYLKFPGFRRSLLASLVANTTASRTKELVTVAATSHGITTGAAYVGFRFFYPGSANLAAGWYDSIVSVSDANTLTFRAPGPDFASESVNGAAAYTTLTMVAEVPLPVELVKPGSRFSLQFTRTGDTTATVKGVRGVVGGQQFGFSTVSSSPNGVGRITAAVAADDFPLNAVPLIGVSTGDSNTTSSSANIQSINFAVPQTYGVYASVGAASGFQALYNLNLEVVL